MDSADNIRQNFQALGIDDEATRIYLTLNKIGHSSALQVTKATGISRTQVYRHLETLQQYSLVSAEQLSYGTLYRALPIETLEGLLADRDAQTALIRNHLADMAQSLQALAGASGPKATMQHYYGVAGLKQANWNLTKAQKEYRVFEAAHLSQHLDKSFARKHRERCIERQLISYDLTNKTIASLKELEPIDPTRAFVRHIDPEILAINFEVYIYDGIVTLLDYSEDNQLALEINHPALAAMMRQMFDAMWQIAIPLEIK